MLDYGSATILGRREFAEAMRNLPGRVVKKVMDEWTYAQASNMAKIARRLAPVDRRPTRKRNKTEGERLRRAIRASRVRNLRKFPHTPSRAIAYGASTRGGRAYSRAAYRLAKRNRGREARGLDTQSMGRRAHHFHLVVRGTRERKQDTTGRRTGRMWGKKQNPRFWEIATSQATKHAEGEVGAQLRDAYIRAIDKEIKRLARKYL